MYGRVARPLLDFSERGLGTRLCTTVVLVHGLSETLSESMATKLAHVLHIFWLFPFPFPSPRFRVFQLPERGYLWPRSARFSNLDAVFTEIRILPCYLA